jgi:hypothetical protein
MSLRPEELFGALADIIQDVCKRPFRPEPITRPRNCHAESSGIVKFQAICAQFSLECLTDGSDCGSSLCPPAKESA